MAERMDLQRSITNSVRDNLIQLNNPGHAVGHINPVNNGQQDAFGFAAVFGYSGFIGFPQLQTCIRFSGFFRAPVLGQGVLSAGLNGSNAADAGIVPGPSYEGHRGNVHGYRGGLQRQMPEGGGYGGFQSTDRGRGRGRGRGHSFGRGRGRGRRHHLNGVDRRTYHYTTTTALAHRNRNGLAMSDMFNLRDLHIFSIKNTTNHVNDISRICYNPELRRALIYHVDCLKALVVRDLRLALSKQIECVNAVMRLLNDAYKRGETWTYPIIYTVIFDLKVITDRAILAGCRGRVMMRYDWAVHNFSCFYHPE